MPALNLIWHHTTTQSGGKTERIAHLLTKTYNKNEIDTNNPQLRIIGSYQYSECSTQSNLQDLNKNEENKDSVLYKDETFMKSEQDRETIKESNDDSNNCEKNSGGSAFSNAKDLCALSAAESLRMEEQFGIALNYRLQKVVRHSFSSAVYNTSSDMAIYGEWRCKYE